MPVMQQPEAYISGSNKLVDDDGKIIEDSKREFLTKFMQSFGDWIEDTAMA